MDSEASSPSVSFELTMITVKAGALRDGYGPVGAWFLLFKAKVMNGAGEDYNACAATSSRTKALSGKYGQGVPGTSRHNQQSC